MHTHNHEYMKIIQIILTLILKAKSAATYRQFDTRIEIAKFK